MKTKNKLPGQSYLAKVPAQFADKKCSCGGAGRWLVQDGEDFYSFIPSTQMQKDIWLNVAKNKIGEEKAISMLRWFCYTCGTAQMP
jgi:hypothetical protein